MKQIVVVILFALVVRAQNAQPQSPLVTDAQRGIQTLREAMRNPDSFAVDRIFVNKDHTLFCYSYRAQNGMGGMNYDYGSYKPNGGINTVHGAMYCNEGLVRNWNRAQKKGWTDITAQVAPKPTTVR